MLMAAAVRQTYLASSLPTKQLWGFLNISTASGVVWFAICMMVWCGRVVDCLSEWWDGGVMG